MKEKDVPRWKKWLNKLNPVDRGHAVVWLLKAQKEQENG